MKLKKILSPLLFLFLTILTQIGGVVYLVNKLTYKYTDKLTSNKFIKRTFRLTSFLILYCLTIFILVPLIARPFGRVPLPFNQTHHLKPLNIITCLLNRNYVRPELRNAAFEVSESMNNQYPGTVINYLDANFPFFNNFPLFPHLSHNDGKKLDISFCYQNSKTGILTNACPSIIGYGICEEPKPGEENTADYCSKKGNWQYSLLKKILPQGNKVNYTFDSSRTTTLVNLFAENKVVGKIFIEPHLKTRLHLKNSKIRFHGCQAVRHDDHIHVQLK